MTALSRWLAPVVLAAGFGAVATTMPAPARADDQLARVIVDIADVIVRNNTPYYRYGNYGYADRLVVVQDRWGRPTYYRNVPRYGHYDYRPVYRPAPPPPRYYSYDRGRYDHRYDNRHYNARYDHRYDNRRYDRDDHRGDRGRHRGWRDRHDD